MAEQTTHFANLNELATGYFLNRETWWSDDARTMFEQTAATVKGKSGRDLVMVQVERGRAMAECLRAKWIANVGTPLTFSEIHWTAHNGVQSVLPSATSDHPADLLLRLNVGFLGVSCKSREDRNVGSGLKNPGLAPLQELLGTTAAIPIVERAVAEVIAAHDLPAKVGERKKAIRAQGLQREIKAKGAQCMNDVRDVLYGALQAKDQTFLRWFIRDYMLNAGDAMMPKYVHVLGTGNPVTGFSAKLLDPFRIPVDGVLSVHVVGDAALGFKSDHTRICKLRSKYESEPLASTLKFSVDVWEN